MTQKYPLFLVYAVNLDAEFIMGMKMVYSPIIKHKATIPKWAYFFFRENIVLLLVEINKIVYVLRLNNLFIFSAVPNVSKYTLYLHIYTRTYT